MDETHSKKGASVSYIRDSAVLQVPGTHYADIQLLDMLSKMRL